MTHHSCIGWVQAGGVWALRVLHFCVCPKLVHCSYVCHGLEARLCILPLIFDLLWCELFYNFPFFMACSLSGLSFAWLWAFLPLAYSFAPFVDLLPFLPYHSTIPTVMLFDLCLLGLFHWIYTHVTLGFLVPLHCLWAPLSHVLLLGHPLPICFPWSFLVHFLILYSHGFLLTLLDFLGPITISFIFEAHAFSINPLLSHFITSGLLWPILTFLHHKMPMGLLFISLGSF